MTDTASRHVTLVPPPAVAPPPHPIGFERRDRCVLCSSADVVPIWSARFGDAPTPEFLDRHFYAGDPLETIESHEIRLVRCRSCGMRFHANVLDAASLETLYGRWIDDAQVAAFEAAAAGSTPRHVTRFGATRRTLQHLLRLWDHAKDHRAPRLLDFGCGDGATLALAGALGFETFGVDLAVASRDKHARSGGASVFGSVTELREAVREPFDAIVLIEVLEHLTRPLEALCSLVRLLRPGGTMLIEVPFSKTDRAPATFAQFRAVHPLEHVNAFTPDTLSRMAQAAGLAPARRRAAHVTSSLLSVVAGELAGLVKRPSTSAYFTRA